MKNLTELNILEILDRRDILYRHQPTCINCKSMQVQLMSTEKPAKWRCRMCKHPFISEPERKSL